MRGQAALTGQGTCIGWVVGDDLFLESTAAYQIAQQGSDRLPVSEQTLRHRMREHGLLASIDAGRQMVLVRRTLGGCTRQVLHLKAIDLVGTMTSPNRLSCVYSFIRICLSSV